MLVLVQPNFSLASSVSIIPSSDHWYGPGLTRVLISDSLKQTAGSTIAPHIEVRRGSTILASADPLIAGHDTSGVFEFYLTTSNAPLSPANPSFPDEYATGRINSSPQLGPRDFSLLLSPGSYLRDGDSVMVTYGGMSQTIQFAKSVAAASVDRTLAGDGNIVVVTIADQNANLDPTAVDEFSASSSVLSVTGGTMNYTGATFVEEGQNSGKFDLAVLVTSGAAGPRNSASGAALSGAVFPSAAQFTVHGYDVYTSVQSATSPYNAVTPNPQASSSQTVVLQNSDGAVSIGSPSAQSGADQEANLVTLKAKIVPPVVRTGTPFWVNATVTNNSTQTIQYSPVCSPSFSVSFAKGLASYQGRPCNIMSVLKQLGPGQTDSVKIPGLDGQYFAAEKPGADNATVSFVYQIADSAASSSNVTQLLPVDILPTNASLDEPFLLAYNQSVRVEQANLVLHFANVTEDSRCPSDVRCIWAGRVSVSLDAKSADSHAVSRLNLTAPGSPEASSSASLDGLAISLQNVSPYPSSNAKPHLPDYVISLVVTKNNVTAPSVEISKPGAFTSGNSTLYSPAAGDKVQLSANATLHTTGTNKLFAVFEVRSLETGVTEYIDYGTADISKDSDSVLINSTSPWVPSAAGNYELRVFVVDNVELPSSLSGVSVSSISVRQ